MKAIALVLLTLSLSTFSKAQSSNDFVLPSATDSTEFKLSEQKGKYIVLHFLLKTECPYCTKHTSEYVQHLDSFPDVVHVFIKPDKESRIKEWAKKVPGVDGSVPVYRDVNAQLAKKLNIPGGYSFHGQTVHYPALIILNKDGKEVFRYVGEDNTDRYPFYRFARKIMKLIKLSK